MKLTNSNQTEIDSRIEHVESLLRQLKPTGPGDVLKSSGRVLLRYTIPALRRMSGSPAADLLVNYSFDTFLTQYSEQTAVFVSGGGTSLLFIFDKVEEALEFLEARK